MMPPVEANNAASTKIVSLARQTSMPIKLARLALSRIILRQWAANDPQAAAAYAAQQGQSGEWWRSPVLQVVNTWAQQDPVAAANWSLSLPDAEAQARSLSMIMRDCL